MRTVRVIPCLDVDAGRVVKGVRFTDLVDAGDPVELARRYDEEGADEVVFLDITASSDERRTMVDVVARTAEEVFIPLTVGGGVRSVEDARRLLRAGADKVGVNTAAVDRPELVAELAAEFGSQCVVVAVDARRFESGGWEVWTHGGRNAHRDRRRGVVRACRRLRRRRDPAHLHGPRRDARRLRPRAHPARWPTPAPSRSSPPVVSGTSTIWSRAPEWAAPTQSWLRRSSISASSPLPRPRNDWRRPACPFDLR